MGKEYNVVVVGGRCAGAPLATLLARAGLSVALAEQARFPRDTLSTHIFQSAALAFLSRLGVLDAVRATGAPGSAPSVYGGSKHEENRSDPATQQV